MKKVTFASIAEACNTSVGTVSRALNGKPDIKPETRNEILRVAKELGYFRQKGQHLHLKHRIGIIFSEENREFYREVIRGINDAKELILPSGMDIVLLQTTRNTVMEQLPLLASIDPGDYDALIINSAGAETNAYINSFMDAGVAVSTFNTDAPNSKRLFFVGTDSFRAGQLAGELLAKLVSGKGRVAVFGNFTGDSSWMSRFNGFCSAVQREYPDIELVPVLQRFDDKETICREIMRLLETDIKITALFPASLTYSEGTIEALAEMQRKDLKVIGVDTTKTNREGLLEGYCDALIYQNPYMQGFLAVKLMVDYLENHKLPTANQTNIPSTIVLKNNIDDVIAAQRGACWI